MGIWYLLSILIAFMAQHLHKLLINCIPRFGNLYYNQSINHNE